MKMSQVRYVLATAQYHSFSKAAEHLYVAQPTLSQQIRLLEAEIGTSLFSRTTREVTLTGAGTEFVRLAKETEESFSRLENLAKRFSSPLSGKLRLGLLWSFTYLRLDRILNAFSHEYPEIRIEFIIGGSYELRDKLANGQLDAAFYNVPVSKKIPDFDAAMVNKSPVCAVLSVQNPLSARTRLSAADLEGQRLILPGEKSTLGRTMTHFLAPVAEKVQIIGRSGQIDVCCHLAERNMAISFLSGIAVQMWGGEKIHAIPLTPTLIRSTYLLIPRRERAVPTAKTLFAFTKKFLASAALAGDKENV